MQQQSSSSAVLLKLITKQLSPSLAALCKHTSGRLLLYNAKQPGGTWAFSWYHRGIHRKPLQFNASPRRSASMLFVVCPGGFLPMGAHLFDWNRPDITVMVDWYFKSQVPFHFVWNEFTVHLELRISVSVMYVRIFGGVGGRVVVLFLFK